MASKSNRAGIVPKNDSTQKANAFLCGKTKDEKRKLIVLAALVVLIIIAAIAVLLFLQRCPDMRIAVFSPRPGMSVVVTEQAFKNETTVNRSIVYDEEQPAQKSMEDEQAYPADLKACPPASITVAEAPLSFQVVREEIFEGVKDGNKYKTKIMVYGDGSVKTKSE